MTAKNLGAFLAQKHPGSRLWLLASLYTVLFLAGLFPVTALSGPPDWLERHAAAANYGPPSTQ